MSNAPHILLSGNTDLGLQYVGYAKAKLAALKRLGLPFLSRAFEIDSVEILIKITPQFDRIFITATYPSILSGFLDTFPAVVLKIDGNGYPIPRSAWQIGTQDVEEQRIPIPPATVATPKMYGLRTTAHPETLAVTSLPPKEDFKCFRDVFEWFLPSKFTGLMRGVMQIAHSVHRWSKRTDVPVDYHFGNCYGVVQNPVTKAYYLLRIEVGVAYYIPATFTVSKTGVAPNVQDIINLVSVKNSHAVKIGDIPMDIGASWSTEIGWAFSYTDPEASIVYEGGRYIGNQNYITAELLKLTFGFDSVTGVPNTATLLRGVPQIFWVNRFTSDPDYGDYGLFTIPRFGIPYPETGPVRLYGESIDFGPMRPYPQIRPKPEGYAVSGIPIYVYYTRAGINTCRYTYQDAEGNSLTTMGVYYFDVTSHDEIVLPKPPRIAVSWQVALTFSMDLFNFQHVPTVSAGNSGSDPDPVYGYGTTQAKAYSNAEQLIPVAMASREVYQKLFGSSDGSHCTFLRYPDAAINRVIDYTEDASGSGSGGAFYIGQIVQPYAIGISSTPITEYTAGTSGQSITSEHSLTLSLMDREACISYSRTVTSQYPAAPNPTHILSSPVTTESETLYGGHTQIKLTYGLNNLGYSDLMLCLHPFPKLLDYKSTTAFFNSENVAYQTEPGSVGAPVVKFDGIQYGVEHKLFGWIGQV